MFNQVTNHENGCLLNTQKINLGLSLHYINVTGDSRYLRRSALDKGAAL